MFSAELAADRARIADIELDILEHERCISDLRAEKAEIQKRFCLVLTLPNEIVMEIFTHFLPVYPLCPPSTGSLSPTSLTHICRAWRDIALQNPTLWRAISLSGTTFPADRLAHISAMLERSGSYPLSIQINEHRPNNECQPPTGSEVLQAVVRHRERWQHLQLRLSHGFHVAVQVEGTLPLLRHLDLELEDDSICGDFTAAPLLRTAILDIVAIDDVILPWTQLTTLTLRLIIIHNGLQILRQTTNLLHCELDLLSDSAPPADEPVLSFPFLESLVLTAIDDCSVADCLPPFVAPALRRLELAECFLGANPIDSLNPLDSLASIISTSGCNLKELCITGERTVREDAYTAAFPSIKEVSFSGQYQSRTHW
ncbi:hypothetical protein C8R47DRAFT_725741 [Mycena vitilis]|nr:hypothetical protein C8R47DRAFT_725741 [Mycena vitilis]